jgi:hypothetical protein
MKKILVAATAAVALATPALAFEVKWSGDFQNRFGYSTQADVAKTFFGEGFNNNYYNGIGNSDNPTGFMFSDFAVTGNNTPNFAKKESDSDFFGELKYRLTLTAADDEKKVNGTLGFEFGAIKFGQVGDSGAPFDGDKKQTLELRWAYTDFEVPFDPASRLYVGLMPVGYNKFLWSDNAAGVKWVSKRGNLGYSLGWFRDDNNAVGGSTKLQNDDAYAFDVTYTVPQGPKVNAFALYLEEGRENDKIAAPTTTDFMDQQIWYGVAAEGQVANFFYGGTFIYEDGKMSADSDDLPFIGGEDELDREAWLANLEVTVKLDKARVKLGYLYSTGDDDALDDKLENFSNIDAYMGGFGSVVVFDGITDDNTLTSAPYILDKGLNMVYLSADYDLNDKATVGASYLWINAAEDLDFGDETLDADKEIGNEVSARASYKITKNLTAAIEAGYLFIGDGLDKANEAMWAEGADDIFRSAANFRYMF